MATGRDVAQRFDGASWSTTGLPSGSSPGEAFGAVSCAADDHCIAVGHAWTLQTPEEGPVLTPIAQHFDGERWSAEEVGGAEALKEVSCATASSCMAAGGFIGRVWTRHRDGSTWRTLPDVTAPGVLGLSALSCATASWCLLTASPFGGGGDQAWEWTGGSSWTPIAPLPSGTGAVGGLSCIAPGECVAVSNWVGPAVHRLSGGAWSPVAIDGLGLDRSSGLTDVACTAVDECVVVGRKGSVDGIDQGLLGVLGDQGWSSTERAGARVIDVECWSGDGCVAVASGPGAAGAAAGHLEVWDGESWRPVEGPPGVARPVAVSCGAPERCEVVGGFVDGDDRATVAAVTVDS
jgi:hypothetical protein